MLVAWQCGALLARRLHASAVVVTDDAWPHDHARRTPPTRIVSVAPGATEMLFAAGAGAIRHRDRRVFRRAAGGAHAFRASAMALPSIWNAWLRCEPDIVVVWPGGGIRRRLRKLDRLWIPALSPASQYPVRSARFIAPPRRSCGHAELHAERAARDIESRLARSGTQRYRSGKPPLTVLLQVWNRPIYTVGGRHLMSDALRLCGARNVFGDLARHGTGGGCRGRHCARSRSDCCRRATGHGRRLARRTGGDSRTCAPCATVV